jgi:hypothetical protein
MKLYYLKGLAIASMLAIAWPAVAGGRITLHSGKSIEILAVEPTPSGDGRRLAIRYRSAIPATDVTALRQEVDEVWQHFASDVDHGGYDTATITANHPPRDSSNNFVFAKKDSIWRTFETKNGKLDRNFVAQFFRRIDWLFEHQDVNALRLYLAGNWTLTLANPVKSRSAPRTVSMEEFLQGLQAGSANLTSYRHKREIIDVTIARGGTTARITSREFEDMVVAGNHTRTSSHSVDDVELTRDGIMLLVRSENVMDKIVKEKAAYLAPPLSRSPRFITVSEQASPRICGGG